jgi:hypothetical protein
VLEVASSEHSFLSSSSSFASLQWSVKSISKHARKINLVLWAVLSGVSEFPSEGCQASNFGFKLSKFSDVQSSENFFPCSWVPDICTVKWYSWVENCRMCTACCGLCVPSAECGYMSISWVCALKPSSLFYTVSEVPSLYLHCSGRASIIHRVHYKQLERILLSYFLSYVFWLLAIPFASENATETQDMYYCLPEILSSLYTELHHCRELTMSVGIMAASHRYSWWREWSDTLWMILTRLVYIAGTEEIINIYMCVCVCLSMLVSLVILVAGFVAPSSTAPLPILSKNRHGVDGHKGEGLMRTAMCELWKISVQGCRS